MAAKDQTISVVQGGQLKSQPSISLENISPANFSRILNLRRKKDQLGRREGWEVFRPDAGQPASPQYTFDGSESLRRLAQLTRGDGTKIVVGASLTKIKYFDTATAAWVQIGSGFSASGQPWQAEDIAGVLVLNNAVDLPQTYEVGDATVLPLHEAREQGIASCGRIGEYNGFLFLGDIVEVKADQLAPWMNGYANHTVTTTTAKAANFTVVAPTDHRTQFDVTTGASAIVATLPAMDLGSVPFFIWLKKSDAGAGTVTTSPAIEDEAVTLDSINDIALIWWNGTRWVARVFPSGSIPAHDPYGIVPDGIMEHIPDEQAWSDLGQPKNFAPLLFSVQEATSTTVNLPFKPFNWTAQQTRLAIIAGGPSGGILGGQSEFPLGILITAFAAFSPATMGVPMTLEEATDASISYPRQIQSTRWADISTSVGKQRLGNGSRITAMVALDTVQIIAHENGFFVNRYTGQAKTPFALRQRYAGKNVPMNGDCVVAFNNKEIVYPSVSRSFYSYNGQSDPAIHELLDDAKDFFFSGLPNTERIWAIENAITSELWFCREDLVLAFCYDSDSIGTSEMDVGLGAAAFVTEPGADEDWFILSVANLVYLYGMIDGEPTTFLRNGSAVPWQLTSGLLTMGTQFREKMLHSYTPLLGSPSPDTEIKVQLRSTYNADASLTDLLTPVETLPSPENENFIPTYFQAVYFQDEITSDGDVDEDFRLTGRIFEADLVSGQGGITRSVP